MKGHLLVTHPASLRLHAAIAGTVLALQLPDGRLLAGGTFEPDDTEPVVRDTIVEKILAELRRLVPAARSLEVERAWCCFRPGTPDDAPIIDRMPGLANVLVNVGHFRTGLLVGPAAGEIVVAWVAGESPGAAGFGLSRLLPAREV